MDFVFNKSLKVITRFDVLEGTWRAPSFDSPDFDVAYISVTKKLGHLGLFNLRAGYVPFGSFGTSFGNTVDEASYPAIELFLFKGKNTFLIIPEVKITENDSDFAVEKGDCDAFVGLWIGKYSNFQTGIYILYLKNDAYIPDFTYNKYGATYYIKGKFGNINYEAEAGYNGGLKDYSDTTLTDSKLKEMGAYFKSSYAIGKNSVGLLAAYTSGDDPSTVDDEGYDANIDFQPCRILFNRYTGSIGSYATTTKTMQNAYLGQMFFDFSLPNNFKASLSVSYAMADKVPSSYISKKIGTEIDGSISYSLMKNMDFSLFGGYLIPGDFYKGTSTTNRVDPTYLIGTELIAKF